MSKGSYPEGFIADNYFVAKTADERAAQEGLRKLQWQTICSSKDPRKALADHEERVKAALARAIAAEPSSESSVEDVSVEERVAWVRKNNNAKKQVTIAKRKSMVDFDAMQKESGLTVKQYAALMKLWLKENK